MHLASLLLTAGAGIAFCVYAGFLCVLVVGLLRLRRNEGGEFPSITVVVPMRDEEENIAATLEALAAQDYRASFEVVCVDDRSTDGTAAIVAAHVARDARFRLVTVSPDEPVVASPKKRALSRGMAEARHEVLATTDADCRPPRGWLSALGRTFGPGVGIVQGPKHIEGPGDAICRYQQIEVLAFVAAEAAGFALGRPFLASAPSLAYRRALYEKAGGFQGIEHLVSGDDDMLVHRMARLPGAGLAYALDPQASVGTEGVSSWKVLLCQRARWASNGTRYENPLYVALLAAIFGFWCWLLAGWIPAAAGLVPWWAWWGFFAAKIPFDLAFLGLAAARFRRLGLLPHYPWCVPLQVAISVYAAVSGHFGWYEWRGQAAKAAAAAVPASTAQP